MSGGNPRRPRVSQAIRETLGGLIENELSDPRISKAGFLTINHVELNRDMGVAEVYIGFYGSSDDDENEATAKRAVEVLVKAAGRLRGPLGRTLQLQRAPELRFVLDSSTEFGMRLSQIIRDDDARHIPPPVESEAVEPEPSEPEPSEPEPSEPTDEGDVNE